MNGVIESIDIFTTCPPWRGESGPEYLQQVCNIARWSDDARCTGMLIYTDNGLLDPWLVSQVVMRNTQSLAPLVAVQPVYMHPYTVAKMVSTLSLLYERRICLNMVAGGFKHDLAALNDLTPHDRRYDRLREYTTVIRRLLQSACPISFEGEFYRVERLALKPPLPPHLSPLITVSGSSPAGVAAARALDAIPIQYPEPPDRCAGAGEDGNRGCGIRVGIIARQDEEEAWRIADQRFPSDRAGQITHAVAMKTSDSVWHHTLSVAGQTLKARSTYWLVPFENYKTFCPYLVGSYEQVAEQISRYMWSGYRTFILDVPASPEDLFHIGRVFEQPQKATV